MIKKSRYQKNNPVDVDTQSNSQESEPKKTIFLVDDDSSHAGEIASQIHHFGYEIKVFNQINDLSPALETEKPVAILMGGTFLENGSTEPDPFTLFKEKLNPSIPVFIISNCDSFSARLDAVRAGSKAFFLKPLNVAELVEVLDDYSVVKTPSSPYRVLIIDDSKTQAFYSSMHLQEIGVSTEIITDPSKVLQLLTDFNPDLILLDIFMPECSGLEVANIIRQIGAFDSIPIVYLSAETDINRQLEAMGIGGDDFLTKPIKPEHLRSAVLSRAERYRRLRALMIRDGLTGLLNNSAVSEQLRKEIIRAGRQTSQLSYVMIDLDQFKLVNDNYGHAVGDRVLKSLARLFKQRLRRSDIIGRYGGEEFVIIFPDTAGPAAIKVMDELRRSFALVQHMAGDKEFTVTFSCGVASYPEYKTPADISSAADRALYEAKKHGRNRTVFASNLD